MRYLSDYFKYLIVLHPVLPQVRILPQNHFSTLLPMKELAKKHFVYDLHSYSVPMQ